MGILVYEVCTAAAEYCKFTLDGRNFKEGVNELAEQEEFIVSVRQPMGEGKFLLEPAASNPNIKGEWEIIDAPYMVGTNALRTFALSLPSAAQLPICTNLG